MEKTQRLESTPVPAGDIPGYVLDDLCSRFIINLPDEVQKDIIRIFFAVEEAHWFYLDFYCSERPELKSCGIKEFSLQIKHVTFLSQYILDHEKYLEEWRAYKMAVPTYGAILLTPDFKHCLLAQGFWTKSSWGFPKGKVDEGEQPVECAIREVFEETGLDVKELIRSEHYVEARIHDQLIRLYIIPGIAYDTHFQPQTRKEIRDLQWFPVDVLPAHKKDTTSKAQLGIGANNFFMVIPFIKGLRRWIAKQTGQQSLEKTGPEFIGRTKGIKGDDGQDLSKQRRQQNRLGPQGDAPSVREMRGGKSLAAKNLQDKFNAKKSPCQAEQQSKQFQILPRGANGGGSTKKNQHHDTELKAGKPRTKASEKSMNVGKLRLDEFHSKALLNFKFDIEPILKCLQW